MTVHQPVLIAEVMAAVHPEPGQTIVDGTFGGGGHARQFAMAVGPTGRVIAIDRDRAAVEIGRDLLSHLPIEFFQANYADIPEVLQQLELSAVDAVLLDLGLSSDQLADRERGFSFSIDGPLDLRFDVSSGEPAWRLLSRIGEKHLADLIFEFGEERFSRRIARRIVESRQRNPIRTSSQLADLLAGCVPRSRKNPIHPATRTFQALRIAVNDELKWLKVALERIPEFVEKGGLIAIISFHSLEDRIVKHGFREHSLLNVETSKPIRATEKEIQDNPRSRSAKLRVASRV